MVEEHRSLFKAWHQWETWVGARVQACLGLLVDLQRSFGPKMISSRFGAVSKLAQRLDVNLA